MLWYNSHLIIVMIHIYTWYNNYVIIVMIYNYTWYNGILHDWTKNAGHEKLQKCISRKHRYSVDTVLWAAIDKAHHEIR